MPLLDFQRPFFHFCLPLYVDLCLAQSCLAQEGPGASLALTVPAVMSEISSHSVCAAPVVDLTQDDSQSEHERELGCFVPFRSLGWGHYQQFVREEGYQLLTMTAL